MDTDAIHISIRQSIIIGQDVFDCEFTGGESMYNYHIIEFGELQCLIQLALLNISMAH